jgi:hypothetical protein
VGQPGGEGGGYPERWWRHRDGRWYPPSLARHPAAQISLGDDDEDDGDEVDVRRSWMAWALLVGPIAVMAGLLLGMMQVALDPGDSGPADTYTAGGTGRRSTTSSPDEERGAGVAPPSGAPSTSAGSSGGSSASGSAEGPDAPAGGSGGTDAPGAAGGPPAASTSGPGAGGSSAANPPASTTPAPPPGSTTPPPSTPATRDDCRDGGWAERVDDQGRPFVNQGQCIAWVEAHPP